MSEPECWKITLFDGGREGCAYHLFRPVVVVDLFEARSGHVSTGVEKNPTRAKWKARQAMLRKIYEMRTAREPAS